MKRGNNNISLLSECRDRLEGLQRLTFFLMPILTDVVGEDLEFDLDNGDEDLVFQMEEQSHETFSSAESLTLAIKWVDQVVVMSGGWGVGGRVGDDSVINMDLSYPRVGYSHVEKVEWLKEEIGRVIHNLDNITIIVPFGMQNAIWHLYEAVFWLDLELDRFNNDNKNGNN